MRRLGTALALAMACASTLGCARATDGIDGRSADASMGPGGDTLDLGSGGSGGGGGGGGVGGGGGGGGAVDLGGANDLASPADLAGPGGGILTGGPCASGATGATAIRVRWINAGGTAQVQYDAFGMPDHSREKVSAYGQIGFSPQFVDQGLGEGGLLLDGSDFVDIELSAAGIAAVDHATLAIYGRSYATSSDGSFSWLSFSDSGETASDFVSNLPPYHWYAADIGNTVAAGDDKVLVRVKSGPSSDALVVNRLEICLFAR